MWRVTLILSWTSIVVRHVRSLARLTAGGGSSCDNYNYVRSVYRSSFLIQLEVHYVL